MQKKRRIMTWRRRRPGAILRSYRLVRFSAMQSNRLSQSSIPVTTSSALSDADVDALCPPRPETAAEFRPGTYPPAAAGQAQAACPRAIRRWRVRPCHFMVSFRKQENRQSATSRRTAGGSWISRPVGLPGSPAGGGSVPDTSSPDSVPLFVSCCMANFSSRN